MGIKGTEAGSGLCSAGSVSLTPGTAGGDSPQTGFVKAAAGPSAAACPGAQAALRGEIKAEEI